MEEAQFSEYQQDLPDDVTVRGKNSDVVTCTQLRSVRLCQVNLLKLHQTFGLSLELKIDIKTRVCHSFDVRDFFNF